MGEEGQLLETEKGAKKIFGARRISRILSVQGVYHFLHNGATLNTIKNFLSEQEFFNQRDSLFFEDLFANTIDNMDDLNKVIDIVRQKQKSLRADIVASKKSSFSVGMKVKVFTKGDTLTGVIKKLNRTKAVVNINLTDYNVPMSIMEVA